jgi:hypothetical protein
MARHAIEKNGLDEDGNVIIRLHTMDANGDWNDTVLERVAPGEADARYQALLADPRHEPWPIFRPKKLRPN